MTRCINQFRTFAAMWTEKKFKVKKLSLQILVKETYAAGKLASAKTISSPWPILAKVWSKSGDKMTGIPFKRPIFFNAENSCFSAGVFIFWFVTQWLFIYSRNLPMKTIRIQNPSNTKSNFWFSQPKKVIFLLKNWILTKYRKLSNFEFLRQNSIIFLNFIF